METLKEIQQILKSIEIHGQKDLFERCSTPVIKDHKVGISFDVSGIGIKQGGKIREQLETRLKHNFPELNFSIILTSNKISTINKGSTSNEDSKGEGESLDNISHSNSKNIKKKASKIHIDGVGKVILISSGKGGVGKSTITALLASSLREQGKKVGVLDADIYGPSIPRIFGVNKKPELDDKKMVPIESFGVQLNSIGFITAPGASISWRGPMVSKALYQLLSLTKWEDLDYLLIDTPPGTGDIHISLMENYVVDGVLMVTTPQIISAIDVERSINLYKKFDTNIIGLIENMSFYLDKNSGKKFELFSGEGGKRIAEQFDIEFLGRLEILPELSKACDVGEDLGSYVGFLSNVTKELVNLN